MRGARTQKQLEAVTATIRQVNKSGRHRLRRLAVDVASFPAADQQAAGLLKIALHQVARLRAKVRREGLTEGPVLRELRGWTKEARELLMELGKTPASRARLGVTARPKPDALQEWLKKRYGDQQEDDGRGGE